MEQSAGNPMRHVRRDRLLTAVAVVALSLYVGLAAGAAEWRIVRERWFTIEINGQRAGWASEMLYDDGERFRLVSDQSISLARGDSDVTTVTVAIESIEMHDGAPVEIRQRRRLGGEPEETVWVFGETGVQRITQEGGREVRVEAPLDAGDEGWLMPHAAEVFEQARRTAGGETIEYRTIDTSAGLRIVSVAQEKIGEAEHVIDNRSVAVDVWKVRRSTSPQNILSDTTVQISENDELVFAEEIVGAMRFTIRSAQREEAQRAIPAVPELLAQTMVRPSRRISGALQTVAAVYRLSARVGDLPDVPSAGFQRAKAEDDGGVRVTIDTRDALAAIDADIANENLLAANPVIDSNNPLVMELAREVTSRLLDDATPAAKAEALRVGVYRHIERKGLASAFATAGETARSRSGDCSEHAVLLCALLRAEGIPARVASGLVYAESFAGQRNVFAWHMWTQALIDGRWIDLDATAEGPFSAAHILAGVTDLSSGALGDEITRLVGLMGNLDIEVISVEHR